MSPIGRNNKSRAFTLVELLVAVAVIAVGMVFVLGALSRCMTSLLTAQKMVTASYLLNQKIGEIDLAYQQNNGSEEGAWGDVFAAPHEEFNWTQNVSRIAADFGNDTVLIQENLNEEVVKVLWKQARVGRDISVTRYVKRKK